jgi:hypothetical protein
MPKEFKLKEEVVTPQPVEVNDDHKRIEVVEMVEVKRTVSLGELKQRIIDFDTNILNLQNEKKKVEDEIKAIKQSLNLK